MQKVPTAQSHFKTFDFPLHCEGEIDWKIRIGIGIGPPFTALFPNQITILFHHSSDRPGGPDAAGRGEPLGDEDRDRPPQEDTQGTVHI